MVQSFNKIVVAAAALNIAATMAMSENADNAIAAREFDDFELEARGLEDFDLEARGIRNRIKGAWKGFKKGKHGAPPASPAPSTGEGETPGRREFFDDELDVRDFDDEFELEARDFDDEFELEARGIRNRIKGAWKGFKKGKHGTPPASPAPSTGEGETPGRREFFDDEFELDARDFDDEFELEARGIRNRIKGAWKGFKKGKHGTPPASPAPSTGEGETPGRREFFDDELELDARDFDDEFELEARDFDDEFELEARGIRNKIKGAWKGFRKGKQATPPASPAPSSGEGETPGRRDVEDLEAREYELDLLD